MREWITRIVQMLSLRRHLLRRLRGRRWSVRHRAGHVLVTTALLLTFLVGLVAFAVDVGAMAVVRGELQRAADAAALAAAAQLRGERPLELAFEEASRYGQLNPVAAEPLAIQSSDVIVGLWDFETRQFTPSDDGVGNAVQVTGRTNRGTLFFGRVAGNTAREFEASAVAAETPREIAFVLDISGADESDARQTLPAVTRIATSFVEMTAAANQHISQANDGRYRDRAALFSAADLARLRLPLAGTDDDYRRVAESIASFGMVGATPSNTAAGRDSGEVTLGDVLQLAVRQLSTSSDGGAARSYADPLVAIVTSGDTAARPETLAAAELIRAKGWRSIVVGVGERVSTNDLARLSDSLGAQSRVVAVADEREFDSVVRPLLADRLISTAAVLTN